MPPQNQSNRYDFIMAPPPPPKRSFNFGNSIGARIGVVISGLIVLIILIVIVNSLLGQASNAQTQRLIEVTQAQTELIRVSALGSKAKDLDTRGLAINTSLSIETSRQQVKKSLVARGMNEKSINKQMAASKNSKTDAALAEATNNNRFDETFSTIINKPLADYQKLLTTASGSGNKTEKTVLAAAKENAIRLSSKQT